MKVSFVLNLTAAIGLVALGATGCVAQAGDAEVGDTASAATGEAKAIVPPTAPPPAREEGEKSEVLLPCRFGFGCLGAPAPTVSASAEFADVSFKAGPFSAGDQILVGAWNGSTWTAWSLAKTAVWSCPAGGACPYWSYYVSGSFSDPAWYCGASETVSAYDATTNTWTAPLSVYNNCIG